MNESEQLIQPFLEAHERLLWVGHPVEKYSFLHPIQNLRTAGTLVAAEVILCVYLWIHFGVSNPIVFAFFSVWALTGSIILLWFIIRPTTEISVTYAITTSRIMFRDNTLFWSLFLQDITATSLSLEKENTGSIYFTPSPENAPLYKHIHVPLAFLHIPDARKVYTLIATTQEQTTASEKPIFRTVETPARKRAT